MVFQYVTSLETGNSILVSFDSSIIKQLGQISKYVQLKCMKKTIHIDVCQGVVSFQAFSFFKNSIFVATKRTFSRLAIVG